MPLFLNRFRANVPGFPTGGPFNEAVGMMMKKWIIRIALAIVLLFVVAGLYFYVAIWRPSQQFYRNEAWWKTATIEEQRDLCHRIISHRFGDHHDPFLLLCRIGNKDSVPLLIRALSWQKPSGLCVPKHCEDALRSLTGQDFGMDSSKWEEWWRTSGDSLSPTNFHERTANKAPEATSEPSPGAASSAPQG